MSRKVIIDCDPGIADALALSIALFDPELEVQAVTAVAGNVSAEQVSRNVQGLIEHLDPPRWPRLGAATEPEAGAAIDTRRLNGDDGLGNCGFAVAELHHQHASEKLIYDIVRSDPDMVTIVCLGPLTNVARALRRDPQLSTIVGRLIMFGGSVNGVGNATAAAEFNMHFDPLSASEVFRSPITKTLVPLDITSQVVFDVGFVNQLPNETTRAGALLRRIATYAFRSHRQELGLEGVYMHEAVALLAALQPELFTMQEMSGDVETAGNLTTGATVFDRRRGHMELPNMEVAVKVEVDAARDAILRRLQQIG
jgi:inosine-uridine nucleoside N-ribohydrolase